MFDKFRILYNEAGDGGEGGGGSGQSLLAGDGAEGGEGSGGSGDGSGGEGGSGTPTFAEGDFRSLVGDDGNFVEGYIDKLPDNLKEHSSHFAKYRSPIQALEHTHHLQQLLGKKGEAVIIPGPDSSEDEKRTFRERLGVPDQASEYDIKKPEDLPEGVEWDEERINGFKNLAHELSLTPQQVAKLVEYDTAQAVGVNEATQTQMVDAEAAVFRQESEKLQKAWGDQFEANKTLSERAALTAGFNEEDIASNPLFRNADFVMTLAKFGKLMSEDSLVKGTDGGGATSPKATADDIVNNINNPYYKRYWAGDEEVVGMVSGLYEKAK